MVDRDHQCFWDRQGGSCGWVGEERRRWGQEVRLHILSFSLHRNHHTLKCGGMRRKTLSKRHDRNLVVSEKDSWEWLWDIKGHEKGNSGYKNPGLKKLQAGESQKVQARAHTRRVKRTVGFYCAWKGKKKVTKRKMLLGKVLPWDLMPMLTARLYAGNHDLLLAMTSFLTPVPYLNSANRYSPFRYNNPTQAKSKCIIGRTHRGTRRWA